MKRAIWVFLLCLLIGAAPAVVYWRSRPQLEVAEKPVPDATVKAALSAEQLAALEQSEKVTLYSLVPRQLGDMSVANSTSEGENIWSLPPGLQLLHGFPVIGGVELKGPRKNALLKAFYSGVSEKGRPTLCWEPRHAIRVDRAGKSFDFLICFQCQQFASYPAKQRGYSPISKSAQPVFDALLKNASVPLSPI